MITSQEPEGADWFKERAFTIAKELGLELKEVQWEHDIRISGVGVQRTDRDLWKVRLELEDGRFVFETFDEPEIGDWRTPEVRERTEARIRNLLNGFTAPAKTVGFGHP